MRRRERRLRSWLRREGKTVAAALVGAVPNNDLRSQRTARAGGERPGVLKEPEVQWEAVAVGHMAAEAPLLNMVVPALRGDDGADPPKPGPEEERG